jgi:hypothetical protein
MCRKCHIVAPDWPLLYTNASLEFNVSIDIGKSDATAIGDVLLRKNGTEYLRNPKGAGSQSSPQLDAS